LNWSRSVSEMLSAVSALVAARIWIPFKMVMTSSVLREAVKKVFAFYSDFFFYSYSFFAYLQQQMHFNKLTTLS